MNDDLRSMADSLHDSKRMIAHSYISSSVDMTSIVKSFAEVPTDAFVIRAAAKAFKAVIAAADDAEARLNVSRVFSHGKRVTYLGVDELRIGEIAKSGEDNGPVPAGQPLIQVY